MNIGNLSIQALLAGTGSLDNIQQTLNAEGEMPQGFADDLMQTISLLKGLGNGNSIADKESLNQLNSLAQFPEIAGFLNKSISTEDFSALVGNQLPVASKLEKEINLDDTFDALADVINRLEDSELNQGQLENKLAGLVEQVETIQSVIPEYEVIKQKIIEVAEEFQNIQQTVPLDHEIDNTDDLELLGDINALAQEVKEWNKDNNILKQQVDNVDIDKLQTLQPEKIPATTEQEQESLQTKQTELTPLEKGEDEKPNLVTRLDQIVDEIKGIKQAATANEIELGVQIEQLVNEIDVIKGSVLQPILSKLELIPTESIPVEKLVDIDLIENEEQLLEQQIAAIVASTAAGMALPQEKVLSEAQGFENIATEAKPELKKEGMILRQMAEEKSLGTSVKLESDSLLQQENTFSKPGQDNSAILAKQKAGIESVDSKLMEQGTEKAMPKFATDIAMLNRAIVNDNKVDVPPMTKHFAHPEWNKEISEKVIWMHKQEIPSAELRLNPRHLGPVTIKIDASQEQTTVAFIAQHAAVKDAIESALPKLREMFSAQQLNLAEVNVSQEDAGQRQPRGFAQTGSESGRGDKNQTNELSKDEQTENIMEISDEIEAGRAIASNGILSIFA